MVRGRPLFQWGKYVAGNSGTPRGSRALAEGGVAANIRVVSNTTHYQEFKKRENARKIKIKIEMN